MESATTPLHAARLGGNVGRQQELDFEPRIIQERPKLYSLVRFWLGLFRAGAFFIHWNDLGSRMVSTVRPPR